MLKLYGYDTINTLKILMLLFETGSDFEFIPINIRTGEQYSPDFRAVNPAGKVPVIWNDGRHQTESNAILLSLAKKASWGLVARTVYTAVIDPYPFLPTPALSISRGKRAKTEGG